MSGFTFSFSGDDIDEDLCLDDDKKSCSSPSKTEGKRRSRRMTGSAFPITGQEILKPQFHSLSDLLQDLPSSIAFQTVEILCDDGATITVPRRELWDVRLQLMAENDDENLSNFSQSDIKTGIYEGGFKSWESSSDLVKVLHQRKIQQKTALTTILELGCGTALPSLYEFQKQIKRTRAFSEVGVLNLGLADYNPTVLQLVTLPNILLSWAQEHFGVVHDSGELTINEDIILEFKKSLESYQVNLYFFSGAWSREFLSLVNKEINLDPIYLIIMGSETIYSPLALKDFAGILLAIMETSRASHKAGFLAAKTFYFGVGGTLTDFGLIIQDNGGIVNTVRKEVSGVARAVLEIHLLSKLSGMMG